MKKSKLKEYIKEIILAELTVTSDKKNAGQTNPVNESEEEGPTEDDIKKGTKIIDTPTHTKGIDKKEKEKFEETKKLINILISKLEEHKKDKDFKDWVEKSSYGILKSLGTRDDILKSLGTREKAKEWIKKNIGLYTKLGADKPTIPA